MAYSLLSHICRSWLCLISSVNIRLSPFFPTVPLQTKFLFPRSFLQHFFSLAVTSQSPTYFSHYHGLDCHAFFPLNKIFPSASPAIPYMAELQLSRDPLACVIPRFPFWIGQDSVFTPSFGFFHLLGRRFWC